MTNNLVGNGGKTYSSNSKLVESAGFCLLWQLVLCTSHSHKTFLLLDIQGLQNTCISCTWIFVIGRNVHRRNFFELFIIYIKLLKYLSVLKYLICTKYLYILTFQLGLVHQRKIFELFTIYIKISWSPWILCFLCNWQDYKIILQSYIFCNT